MPAVGAEFDDFDCLMEPYMTVKLSTPVDGVIHDVTVDRGDTVRRGQTMARLDFRLEKAALALAELRASNVHEVGATQAQVRYLRQKYERIQKLNSSKFSTDAALQEVETDVRMAEQELAEAKLNLQIAELEAKRAEMLLDQRSIKSPVDGVVVERMMVPGEYRNEQSHIVTIAQIDPINVEVFVPIEMHGRIEPGQTALVRPASPVNGVYTATVTVVDRVYDAASGTFGVRLELPNPKMRLPAGIHCRVSFDTTIVSTVKDSTSVEAREHTTAE